LSPICQYRKSYIHPSKGKKSKARKRKLGFPNEDQAQAQPPVPPPPAIAASVDVGLTHITRNLADSSSQAQAGGDGNSDHDRCSPYAIIFVVRSGTPSTLFSHLPQMVAAASRQLEEPIRLIGLSKPCEERLSASLGIPRVSSVALRVGASGQLKGLVDLVRKQVAPVEARWVEDGGKWKFHETKINSIQAPIGAKRQKKA
jgi:ribonuclease P/MRP protein subunit POP3